MASIKVVFLRGHRDRQHEAALSAIVKGLPMTKNNRLRKSISGNEDNLPGLAHVNAFLISENSNVGKVIEHVNLRVRKMALAGARLAPRSTGFCSRLGARMSPGFQLPVTCFKSLLVMLLRSHARRLA